ncbi:MAG: phosphoribulokinase [Alphaproteobacteria bacterium]|nr:phosphoribulokinase [Alphaproteobacteria bacterium]
MPVSRHVQRPIILGIVGDSASGKTTLSAGIAAILGPDRVATICTDDYHRLDRAQRAAKGLSALDPEANYLDILEQHIHLLRDNQPILKPVYNHDGGKLERPEYIEPKPYIILEGLLGYTTRTMRDGYDVKLYLEPEEALRERWKIQRDTARRGYAAEEVVASLEKRKSDSPQFIQPQRTFADMVVRFYPPETNLEETGAKLNARLTLRPTLPHPDLSPVVDVGAKNGVRLELARDVDGKPVDVLEISGDIEERRFKALEELLWSLIPEASHLRGNLGQFTDATDINRQSHPLALVQLLVAYHLVKAAMGHYAT